MSGSTTASPRAEIPVVPPPPLGWGRHYAVVEPQHFRVEYAINPFMDPTSPEGRPDPGRALRQWRDLVATLRGLGARVDVLPQLPDAPDMVYAMNLGLAVTEAPAEPAEPAAPAEAQRRLLLSHMRFEQRRMETPAAEAWFAARGWAPTYLGRAGVGPSFEAGDAFPWAGELVVGHGPRTDELALKHLATELGVRVRGVRTTHPGMYHLDLAFCPLDERRAMVCPDALEPASAARLLEVVPEPLVITEEEALTTFCANSVVVGRTVVMPACPGRVRRRLEEWGFAVRVVDVSEFHKGGGSVRCLTNPLDIRLGRDLVPVPGGEVAPAPR